VKSVFLLGKSAVAVILICAFLLTMGCSQVPSAPAEGTMTAASTPTTAPVTGGRVIAAYFYIFDDASTAALASPDQIPWKKVNRIYIAFATLKDGMLTDLPAGSTADDLAQRETTAQKIHTIVALCHENNPDAEIFITSNFDEKELDPQYLLAAQDPQKFADSVLAYLKEYDLDGYDMDWESHQIDDYAPQLTTLLSTCHATFAAAGNNPHGHPYTLTYTVWPGVESAQTVASTQDSVDQINLMTYGPGEGYDLASYADSYAAAGVPYGKMIGGLESEAGYSENGGPDTQESVAAKCAYVKEHNLAGLFEWRMDNDMRPDNGAPTYQVTGWMSDCLSQ
jgi:GH18 family chitinase